MEAGAPLNLHTIKYVAQEALDAQARKQESSKKAKRKQLDVSGLTTIGGNSALALAIRHGHGGIVEYLLQMVRGTRQGVYWEKSLLEPGVGLPRLSTVVTIVASSAACLKRWEKADGSTSPYCLAC